jgi:hypothetical protein
MAYEKSRILKEVISELEKRNEPATIGELETALNRNRVNLLCVLGYLKRQNKVALIGNGRYSKWILKDKLPKEQKAEEQKTQEFK